MRVKNLGTKEGRVPLGWELMEVADGSISAVGGTWEGDPTEAHLV